MAKSAALVDTADRLALVASGACLLHCLALPLLFAALPALSQAFQIPESFHIWMIAVAVPTSAFARLTGSRRHRGRPLLIGVAGLGLLVVGGLAIGETRYEAPVSVAGALVLATAHVLNWRRRHADKAIDQ